MAENDQQQKYSRVKSDSKQILKIELHTRAPTIFNTTTVSQLVPGTH